MVENDEKYNISRISYSSEYVTILRHH